MMYRVLCLLSTPQTARSRHHAFIEFANAQVAQIVAESMDGYMMFGKTLACQYVVPDKVHPNTFLGSEHTVQPRVAIARKAARMHHNRKRSTEDQAERDKAAAKRLANKRKQMAALGIVIGGDADVDADMADASATEAATAAPAKKKAKTSAATAAAATPAAAVAAPAAKTTSAAAASKASSSVSAIAPKPAKAAAASKVAKAKK